MKKAIEEGMGNRKVMKGKGENRGPQTEGEREGKRKETK